MARRVPHLTESTQLRALRGLLARFPKFMLAVVKRLASVGEYPIIRLWSCAVGFGGVDSYLETSAGFLGS